MPTPAVRLEVKDMPQLDFREALSTPNEKVLYSAPPVVAAVATAVTPAQVANSLFRDLRLSRATLTNVVFVAIAAVGGLVCAFYFFNGGELLQAAADWPSEFIYPRPASIDKIDITQLPNPVDQFSESNGALASTKNNDQDSSQQNLSTPNVTQ